MIENKEAYIHEEESTLRDYIDIIIKRKTTFILAFLVTFISIAVYTFTTKPIYESFATLYVKDEQKTKMPNFGELAGMSMSSPIDAEIEILKSRTNVEEVAKRLHLNWQIAEKSPAMEFEITQFSSPNHKPTYEVTLVEAGKYVVRDMKGTVVGNGETNVVMQGSGIVLQIDNLKGRPGDKFNLTLFPFNDVVMALQKKVVAKELGKKTNIMKVSFTDTSPYRAMQVVNTLTDVYLERNISFKSQEASKTLEFLGEQMKGLKDELDTAEKGMQEFKSQAKVVMLDAETQKLITKTAEAEKDKTTVNLQKKQVEFAIDSLKEAIRKGRTYTPAYMKDDPMIASLTGKMAELEIQKNSLLSEYTESHPQVRKVREQIDQLQHKILASYESTYSNLDKQSSAIGGVLASAEGELRKLPEAERELAKHTRHTKVNADIYTLLLQKHEEARIAKASTISSISVVDPGILTDLPIRPQKLKNLLLGFLAALFSGIGLAFLQDHLDDTIKSADKAKRLLGLPIYAVIPYIPHAEEQQQPAMGTGLFKRALHGRSGAASLPARPDVATSMVVFHKPKSTISEAYRSLRTSIHFSSVSKKRQTLMVTSSFPGEGKSTTVSNLALTMTQIGAKVVLIDCDLRRSTLHELLKARKVPGLSEILLGDVPLEKALHSVSIKGLDFIASGTTPPNPAELLASDRMKQLIEHLKSRYDYILLDSPPMLAVTDSHLLTNVSDMVLLVVESGRVPLKAALHVREILQNIQAPLTGLIMNDKSHKSAEGYGYGYGKYYRYGYYGYGHYDEDHKDSKKSWWRRGRDN